MAGAFDTCLNSRSIAQKPANSFSILPSSASCVLFHCSALVGFQRPKMYTFSKTMMKSIHGEHWESKGFAHMHKTRWTQKAPGRRTFRALGDPLSGANGPPARKPCRFGRDACGNVIGFAFDQAGLLVLPSEVGLAVEHLQGIGNGVVCQRDGADGLGQADSLVQAALVDVAAGGVAVCAAHVDLVVQLGQERLGVNGGTAGANQARAGLLPWRRALQGLGGRALVVALGLGRVDLHEVRRPGTARRRRRRRSGPGPSQR